jgi:hypothetical protein
MHKIVTRLFRLLLERLSLRPWRWRKHVRPKRLWTCTRVHGVTSQWVLWDCQMLLAPPWGAQWSDCWWNWNCQFAKRFSAEKLRFLEGWWEKSVGRHEVFGRSVAANSTSPRGHSSSAFWHPNLIRRAALRRQQMYLVHTEAPRHGSDHTDVSHFVLHSDIMSFLFTSKNESKRFPVPSRPPETLGSNYRPWTSHSLRAVSCSSSFTLDKGRNKRSK